MRTIAILCACLLAQRALALYLAGEGSRHDERICDTLRAELGLTALQKALPHVSKKR